jgi:undecaprenyl phosphate-alpha-L-ara4FN deformylase
MFSGLIALRVDVDTRRGLERGVPRLLDLFSSHHVVASFFIVFGPDRSGRAVRRLFVHRGFARRMWRLGAPLRYGFSTMVAGTLVPSLPVGTARPDFLRRIMAEGHEVGMHGHDHVRWQDRLEHLGRNEIAHELAMAAAAYRRAVGRPPLSSAAPGWRTNEQALLAQERYHLLYASDVRGHCPFRPVAGGSALATVQIPVTMPTIDEIYAWDGAERRMPEGALVRALEPGRLNVLAVHAEVAGQAALPSLERFLTRAREQHYTICRLEDVARELCRSRRELPRCEVRQGRVPGRAGTLAMQGEPTELESSP